MCVQAHGRVVGGRGRVGGFGAEFLLHGCRLLFLRCGPGNPYYIGFFKHGCPLEKMGSGTGMPPMKKKTQCRVLWRHGVISC